VVALDGEQWLFVEQCCGSTYVNIKVKIMYALGRRIEFHRDIVLHTHLSANFAFLMVNVYQYFT